MLPESSLGKGLSYVIPSLAALHSAAGFIEQHRADRRVIALDAPMGAGKTTLIRALCQLWGVVDTVTSPTFAIHNVYATSSGRIIQHMDLYRLNRLEEVLEIGLLETIDTPGTITLIEWPGLIEELLPANTMRISLEVMADQSRRLIVDC